MKVQSLRAVHCRTVIRRKALAIAIGGSIALAFAGGAWAQAVNGTIQGSVPIAANESIQITGGAGYNRTISVGPSGRYSVTLPVGTYTVSLLQDGKVVQSQFDVIPTAAGHVDVSFKAGGTNIQTLSSVNVSANSIPAIDVTSTNQTTTFTSKQLTQLPLARTTENIAMLAPGVTAGAALLPGQGNGQPMLVFNGTSVAENAYYIDGMNVTNALTGQGGIDLPYGSIEQAQIITTGYSAKYGRSIGGVINQIGKSGSNEFHFGARAIWEPADWRSDVENQLWNNPRYTGPLALIPSDAYGQLRNYQGGGNGSMSVQRSQETVYDAYVSGPIIKDKLFFFLSLEQDNSGFNQIAPNSTTALNTVTTRHQPKIFAKINWNINNDNLFSLTALQTQTKDWQSTWHYDYTKFVSGDFNGLSPTTKNSWRTWVANYTSYLSDNLTLNAMFGKTHAEYFTQQPGFAGFDPSLPTIIGSSEENPAFTPNGPISNSNPTFTTGDPAHRASITNYRVSLDYRWGNHDFSAGIDNITTWDKDDGTIDSGPGYAWFYQHSDPGTFITGTNPSVPPWVAAPNSTAGGEDGYYVAKYIFLNAASVRVAQRAAYVMDNWQVTPNLLLNLGLRDDSFTNYNPAGLPYIRLTKPQWAPRLGLSWNVFGDSSLKVYGNAGRYYLALPAAVALRGAGASTFTSTYYTYTGVDANGIPQGLTAIPQNNGGHAGMGVSANNEYGNPLNPAVVAAQNVGAEYGDQYVLGLQKKLDFLGTSWVAGADATYMKLGRIVDDWDDEGAICGAAMAQGVAFPGDPTSGLTSLGQCINLQTGAVLVNPTAKQDLIITGADGKLHQITVDNSVQGFERPVKRDYYAINLSLEHPWDGKWFGKIVYTFSRDWGNTEGPVDSTIGQGANSVSITEQWDFHQLMENSYGVLPNDHKHQLKVYGAYAITPDWQVGGSLYVASGAPADCLGGYGPGETDPLGYNTGSGTGSYHWCGGVPTPPGSTGFTPWIHELNLSVDYIPTWAKHKLSFQLAVLNVFNNQTPTQLFASYALTGNAPDPHYQLVEGRTPPRAARFTVAYNW